MTEEKSRDTEDEPREVEGHMSPFGPDVVSFGPGRAAGQSKDTESAEGPDVESHRRSYGPDGPRTGQSEDPEGPEVEGHIRAW